MDEFRNNLAEAIPGYVKNDLGQINVRALLVARNIKQTDIAERHKFGKAEVNKVINGKRRTQRIRQAIAQELGMSVEDLWGNT